MSIKQTLEEASFFVTQDRMFFMTSGIMPIFVSAQFVVKSAENMKSGSCKFTILAHKSAQA